MDKIWFAMLGDAPVRAFMDEPEALSFVRERKKIDITKVWRVSFCYLGRNDDEIDDAIDAWHKDAKDLELHEYLGWSWPRYKAWVEQRPEARVGTPGGGLYYSQPVKDQRT